MAEANDKPLILNYPYAPPSPIMPEDIPAQGAMCDPRFRDLYARLLPFRYDTAFFRYTRNAVTGALSLAAAQTVTLFSAGINETSPQTGGGTLDASDTTGTQQGGLVMTGQRWLSVGARISVEEPFAVAPGASGNGARNYTSALRREDGLGYNKVLGRAVADTVSAEVNHGSSSACRYTLGALAELGDCGQTGPQIAPGGLPGQFWFFATPDNSGGSRDSDQLNLILTQNKAVTIEQNALNPTDANVDVIVPVRFGLVGVPFCATGTGNAAMDALLDRAIAEKLKAAGLRGY